jgi:hypothetical protein
MSKHQGDPYNPLDAEVTRGAAVANQYSAEENLSDLVAHHDTAASWAERKAKIGLGQDALG